MASIDIVKSVPEIRIISMSSNECPDDEQNHYDLQQNYFLGRLIDANENDGRYYNNQKITSPVGTLLLFSFKNEVVACATFLKNGNQGRDKYSNYYLIDKNSVKVFEPITKSELQNIIPEFTNFGRLGKKTFDGKYALPILSLIESRLLNTSQKFENYKNNAPTIFPDELPDDSKEYKEGVKKSVLVNVYERNMKARQKCIEYYGANCFICGFDFKIYGDEFAGMIHVHHLKMISEVGSKYVIDPVRDLRPICPNCHMVTHKKKECYAISEMEKFAKKLRESYTIIYRL